MDLGLLEELHRPGKGGTKYFKSLTQAGLRFGKNLINPRNEREVQPHYFEDTFDELLEELEVS
jgi:hypothetical protein